MLFGINSSVLAQAATLLAGPMLGHVTDTSARVWMQFSTATEVSVEVYDVDRNRPINRVGVPVEGPWPFVFDTPLGGLEPNRNYRIRISVEGKPLYVEGPELIIRTAPPIGQAEAFTFAFGGMFDPAASKEAGIFRSIVQLRPRAFLFLGNCGLLPATEKEYPETRRDAYRMMIDMHRKIRRLDMLEPLFRNVAVYNIWGTHDYGPDHADGNWVYQQESMVAFQRYWPNPTYGTPDTPGLFYTFQISDVDFFVLDDRTYSNPHSLLGEGQTAWLKKMLLSSPTTFKVIATPTQFLAASNPASWPHHGNEQQEFLKWLAEKNIRGVLFISGESPEDLGELTRIAPSGSSNPLGYTLYDLTASRLMFAAVSPADTIQDSSTPTNPGNPDRFGTAVRENHFGTLEFGGPRTQRFVTLRLRDQAGTIKLERTIFASELSK